MVLKHILAGLVPELKSNSTCKMSQSERRSMPLQMRMDMPSGAIRSLIVTDRTSFRSHGLFVNTYFDSSQMKGMQVLLAAFICFCWAGAACGQNVNSDAPAPLTPEEMIRQMIELRSVEGQMQKRIGNMGDAAAVVVTRILAGDEPRPVDIDMVLTVLDLSFADPSAP